MADFSTYFAQNSDSKRLPTNDEKLNGFPCGPADRNLFNGMFSQLQRELKAIHDAGGVAGSDTDFNTTLLNIQALIDAATGGAATENYLLISQANARLPIFPEFLTSDGRINVVSPSTGTVKIPAGVSFMHRGISPHETVETDFSTVANKTYHLRWNTTDGYVLKDTADVTYNPSALVETDTSFDSTYDDMLISRVITNSSNVPTITNLANKSRLVLNSLMQAQNWRNPNQNQASADFQLTINWARQPDQRAYNMSYREWNQIASLPDTDFIIGSYGSNATQITASPIYSYPISRYESKFAIMIDNASNFYFDVSLGA